MRKEKFHRKDPKIKSLSRRNFLGTTGAAESGKVIKLANIYALCDVDPNYAGHILRRVSQSQDIQRQA